jgi:hypothetical protein
MNDDTPLEPRSAKGTPHHIRQCLRLSPLPLVGDGSLAFSLRSLPSISTFISLEVSKTTLRPLLKSAQEFIQPPISQPARPALAGSVPPLSQSLFFWSNYVKLLTHPIKKCI